MGCCDAETARTITPIKWELNANSYETVKATHFKFDKRVPRDSPDMKPINFPNGAWPGSRDALIFGRQMHANSSKTVKATAFKFDKHVSGDSSYMKP